MHCFRVKQYSKYVILGGVSLGGISSDIRLEITFYGSTGETIYLPSENFEYGYPHSNALLQFLFKLKHCKPHKAAHHPTKCDLIADLKLFLTVYSRIHCRKLFTLSIQMLRYKSKCIRILVLFACFILNFRHL